MKESDLERVRKIVVEVLANDQRGKLFDTSGKKIGSSAISEIASIVVAHLQYFVDDNGKPKPGYDSKK